MLRKYALVDGKISETTQESAVLWMFVDPDSRERELLSSTLKIGEHNLASALDPDEMSRVEVELDHTALLFKYPKHYQATDEFLFRVAPVGMFLFPERLIVIIPEDVPVVGIRLFEGATTPRVLLLKFIYRVTYRYLDHLKAINMISDEIEKKISVSVENRHLLNLFSLEKSLVYYLTAIGANSATLEKLKNMCSRIGFSPQDIELLDDIIIDNHQCYRQAEISSNILAGLMDARAALVGNNLNILMKKLNLITIGIMVPTLVVSAFSMNVRIPLAELRYAFWIVMGLATASLLGVLYWWKTKRL